MLMLLLPGGCTTNSAGAAPLQDTLHGHCPRGEIRQCRVWGGNKFRKRYEYCGCRRT